MSNEYQTGSDTGRHDRTSATDWDAIDALTDDMIDTSDIPPLDDAFFTRAKLRLPKEWEAVAVQVAPDVFAWYQAQGDQWEARMRAALRIYVDPHQELPEPLSPPPEAAAHED